MTAIKIANFTDAHSMEHIKTHTELAVDHSQVEIHIFWNMYHFFQKECKDSSFRKDRYLYIEEWTWNSKITTLEDNAAVFVVSWTKVCQIINFSLFSTFNCSILFSIMLKKLLLMSVKNKLCILIKYGGNTNY